MIMCIRPCCWQYKADIRDSTVLTYLKVKIKKKTGFRSDKFFFNFVLTSRTEVTMEL